MKGFFNNAQGGLNPSKTPPQISPGIAVHSPFYSHSVLRRSKTRPRRAQTPPRRSQDAPKTPQDAPQTPQDASKTPQDASRHAHLGFPNHVPGDGDDPTFQEHGWEPLVA